MSRCRYVIEGTWTGYRSSQERVVHRTVTTDEKLVEWIRNTYEIRYGDGTGLLLEARPARPREKVVIKDSYGSLIEKCFRKGVTSVDALYAKESA